MLVAVAFSSQLHLNVSVPAVELEVTTNPLKKDKDWYYEYKAACKARGERLGQTYGAAQNEYTRPFSLPLRASTTILRLRAVGIEAKKQSATYASQLDIYLDNMSLSIHNYGVPTKCSKTSFHTEDCQLFNVLTVSQKAPSDFSNQQGPRRLLRIVKHPVGCHWIQEGGISAPTGIGKKTLTVHVQAVDLTLNAEPMLFGRILHLIAAAKKSIALGAQVKEEVWGGKSMLESDFLSAMAEAASASPPKLNPSSSPLSSSDDPILTLNIATGAVKIQSYWGKDAVDVLSFDSSTTCVQKFDAKMNSVNSTPLTLLGSIENLRLKDLTGYGRQAYADIISPCSTNSEETGVTAEWTFTAASVNRRSPPIFGIRLKGMKFVYAQRKVMENLYFWQQVRSGEERRGANDEGWREERRDEALRIPQYRSNAKNSSRFARRLFCASPLSRVASFACRLFRSSQYFCSYFQLLGARPEDILSGSSVIMSITAAKKFTWVQGSKSTPFRADKHPGWRAHKTYEYEQGFEKEKVAQEAKIEILAVDSEIWLLHDSKHYDAIKVKFPTFKMWKAVSSEENYYSSPLLDQHKFAHEIPSMNRMARVRGKRVTSFSDLAEFGIRKKRPSEQR